MPSEDHRPSARVPNNAPIGPDRRPARAILAATPTVSEFPNSMPGSRVRRRMKTSQNGLPALYRLAPLGSCAAQMVARGSEGAHGVDHRHEKPRAAHATAARLPGAVARAPARASESFVFPGDGRAGPPIEPRKQVLRVCAASGVDFRLHDLHRNSESVIIPSSASNDVALSEMTSWTGWKRCSELYRFHGLPEARQQSVLSSGMVT